jgi:hypothetical protein
VPSEWPSTDVDDVPVPPVRVQLWIAGACGVMVCAVVLGAWALAFTKFVAAGVLGVAAVLAAAAMVAGMNYADRIERAKACER